MIRSAIYDTLILRLTTRWYRAVLERLPEEARVLDVGIGTAGALLANTELVKQKRLAITGIDIDGDYIERARQQLAGSGLEKQVEVFQESVYDHQGGPYDAIYFSASFMLLPDPEGALQHTRKMLREGGVFYFTQTIQRRESPLMNRLKPLLRRVTSIDFGQVTYEQPFRDQLNSAGLRITEFRVLASHGQRDSCLIRATAEH